MKNFGAFTTDGYKASIEFPKFIRDIDIDFKRIISAIVGNSIVFIKGGAITIDVGNTTITDGIVFKDGEFYSFTGGTYAAALPADLKVKFTEQTSSGYPVPYFGINPVDIYLDKIAYIDGAGTITLSTIGSIYDLQALKSKVDLIPSKAGKNAHAPVTGTTVSAGFTEMLSTLNVQEYENGTIRVVVLVAFTGAKSSGVQILDNLPANLEYGLIIPVLLSDASSNETVGYCKLIGSSLSVFSGFSAGIVNAIISFSYKKS